MGLIVWLCLATLLPVPMRQSRSLQVTSTKRSDADANAIYAAALIQLLRQKPRHSDCLVLPAKAESFPVGDVDSLGINGNKNFWKAWKMTLLGFVRAGTVQQPVDRSAIQSALRTAFRDDHITLGDRCVGTPDMLSVSSIGFNDGRTKALVFASHECGSWCCYGTSFFLERKKEAWIIVIPKGAEWGSLYC